MNSSCAWLVRGMTNGPNTNREKPLIFIHNIQLEGLCNMYVYSVFCIVLCSFYAFFQFTFHFFSLFAHFRFVSLEKEVHCSHFGKPTDFHVRARWTWHNNEFANNQTEWQCSTVKSIKLLLTLFALQFEFFFILSIRCRSCSYGKQEIYAKKKKNILCFFCCLLHSSCFCYCCFCTKPIAKFIPVYFFTLFSILIFPCSILFAVW